jgi:hypothetical protein
LQSAPAWQLTLPLWATLTSQREPSSHVMLHESLQRPLHAVCAPHASEQLVGPHVIGLNVHIESAGQVHELPLHVSVFCAAQPQAKNTATEARKRISSAYRSRRAGRNEG